MASSVLAGKAERENFWREQVGAWRVDVERAERAGRAAISVREFCRGRGLREPSFILEARALSAWYGRGLCSGDGSAASRDDQRTHRT